MIGSPEAGQILADIFGPEGYSTALKLSSDELEVLRELTLRCWHDRLREAATEQAAEFERIGMPRYHELADRVCHETLWTVDRRDYPVSAVEKIKSFGVFRELQAIFPGYVFTGRMPPYPDLGWDRMTWRIVRPGRQEDNSLMHADYWFDPRRPETRKGSAQE